MARRRTRLSCNKAIARSTSCSIAATRARAAAQEPLDHAVALARQAGDTWCLADALGKLGAAALYRSEATEARPLLEESLAIAREAEDQRSIHRALGGLARVAAIEHDVDRAIALLQESLVLSKRLDDRIWIALDLAMLGEFERLAGRPREGEVLARRGMALAEEIGSGYARYMATGLLGESRSRWATWTTRPTASRPRSSSRALTVPCRFSPGGTWDLPTWNWRAEIAPPPPREHAQR